MQVELRATPMLTEDKASFLPGRLCAPVLPPLNVGIGRKSEWKEDIEWIAHHTLSDVKQYAVQ